MKKLVLLLVIALLAASAAYADSYPESPHPYGNSLDQTWTYTAASGTERMDVTFSDQTEVEQDFDFIQLLNENGSVLGVYTGSASAEGYSVDGTPLKLSDKDQKWLGIKETFTF